MVFSFDSNTVELYEVGALEIKNQSSGIQTNWPIVTLPKLEVSLINTRKSPSPRCLCKLGLGLPLPIPIPIPVNTGLNAPVVGVNNNVAATQLLSDGRTALYNNQGQIIGFLPAGSTVTNQNPPIGG